MRGLGCHTVQPNTRLVFRGLCGLRNNAVTSIPAKSLLHRPFIRGWRYRHSIDDSSNACGATRCVNCVRFLLGVSNRAGQSHFALHRLNDDMTW